MSEQKKGLSGLWIGVKGGLISSLCCAPVVLILPILLILGVESYTIAFALTRYRIQFILIGTFFVAVSLYVSFKRRYGTYSIKTVLTNKRIIAVALLTQLAFFTFSYYVILPTASELVFSSSLLDKNTAEENVVSTTSTLPATTTIAPVAETAVSTTLPPPTASTTLPPGPIGVEVTKVEPCNSLKYNYVFASLTDQGVGGKKWGVTDPAKYFRILCDGQDLKYYRIERRSTGAYYTPTRLKNSEIAGDYRIRVRCGRDNTIGDVRDCSLVTVAVNFSGETGGDIYSIERGKATSTVGEDAAFDGDGSAGGVKRPYFTRKYEGMGYRLAYIDIDFICPSCVPAVNRIVRDEPGVKSRSMAFRQDISWVVYDPEKVSIDRILMLSRAAGDAELVNDTPII